MDVWTWNLFTSGISFSSGKFLVAQVSSLCRRRLKPAAKFSVFRFEPVMQNTCRTLLRIKEDLPLGQDFLEIWWKKLFQRVIVLIHYINDGHWRHQGAVGRNPAVGAR